MADTQVVLRKATALPAPMVALMQGLVPDCTALLPSDISTEQFRAALWLELTGRPDLHDCTSQSLRECVVKAATYGLLPGRDCHFLPFRNRKGNNKVATYVPNYQGILLALERTGKVRRAFAHPVYEGDLWDYDHFADRPMHKPAYTMGKKQGPELFYYGAIQFRDGTFAVDLVSLEDLDKIRRSAPAHESGPWVDWPIMMKRKTALKRVAKYVQLTPQLVTLLDEDDARLQEDIPPDRHRQNIVDLFGEGPRGSTPQPSTTVDVATGEVIESPEAQGQAADDLCGDGAGDVFRDPLAEGQAPAPVVRTIPEESITPASRLSAFIKQLAWTTEQQRAWENKQARRFRKTFSDLPPETITALVVELEEQFIQETGGVGEQSSQSWQSTAPLSAVDEETHSLFNLEASALVDQKLVAE